MPAGKGGQILIRSFFFFLCGFRFLAVDPATLRALCMREICNWAFPFDVSAAISAFHFPASFLIIASNSSMSAMSSMKSLAAAVAPL